MTKKFKKSRFSFDETIAASKFDFCKNLKWFIIAPIAILIVGIILLCTIGFNLNIDFTGGSIITIYANNEQIIEEAESYNLDDGGDFSTLKEKVENVLSNFDVSGATYQVTTMDIAELGVYHGQALVVKYQNAGGASTQQITQTNSQIQESLIAELGLTNSPEAVANGGIVTPSASNELIVNSFIAIIATLVLIAIYLALRFGITSSLAATLTFFHDILITSAIVLILRLTIGATFIAALVTILCFSACNSIVTLSKIKENQKSGKFEGKSNVEIANASVKETLSRSVFTTFLAVVCMLLLAVIGISDMRIFAVSIAIGILASFYSSIFIVPGLWAMAFAPKRKVKSGSKSENSTDNQNSENLKEIAG